MSRRKQGNTISVDGSIATIHIKHFGRVVAVLVDAADVELIKSFTWSIATLPNGYSLVQTSAWTPGLGQRSLRLSRLLMGEPEGLLVDHINRDPLDNRKANLRIATYTQNNQNRSSKSKNKTGWRGVTETGIGRGQFVARVQVDGKSYKAGPYDDPSSAAKAALALRAKLMPFSEEADQFRRRTGVSNG